MFLFSRTINPKTLFNEYVSFEIYFVWTWIILPLLGNQ